MAAGRGRAAKTSAAERADQNALRILRVLASIPESERLDALTIALDVWLKVPSLRAADVPK